MVSGGQHIKEDVRLKAEDARPEGVAALLARERNP
jgi:hypothetical protein